MMFGIMLTKVVNQQVNCIFIYDSNTTEPDNAKVVMSYPPRYNGFSYSFLISIINIQILLLNFNFNYKNYKV
jgi:hypothetical protein